MLNAISQRFSLYQFHHEEVAAVDFFDAIDRGDVRVIQ
jgi:hypothetical protein